MASLQAALVPCHLSEQEYSRLEAALRECHPREEEEMGASQVSSVVAHRIGAPLSLVWSLVRRFDRPESYKRFIRSCHMQAGDGCDVGSIREVSVVSGLPAVCSRERLEVLDEDRHILSFSVVGGEHRLRNYRSTTSLHELAISGGTLVVESYVVDVPNGNSRDDTLTFVDTVVKCNLQSLANLCERMLSSCSGSGSSALHSCAQSS